MPLTWKAPKEIVELVNEVKNKHHVPRLLEANVAVALTDTKPFKKNRFNYGNVVKFSTFNQMWQGARYDFCITLCATVWRDILTDVQRESLIDLLLERCSVEYEPETVEENGKKIVLKDDVGRIKYTDEIKVDEEGVPKWVVNPLDLHVFAQNAKRYGLWCDDLDEIKSAIT